MVYQKIPIDSLEPNPFQTREKYDFEVLAGIATSAMDDIGIRNPPIVRPHPKREGKYQIASGHGRVGAWKSLGHDIIECRIEDLTDSQMKKEVLIENVNRADLSEGERMTALEAYRVDLGLEIGEPGYITRLERATGIPNSTLSTAYDVKHMRELLSTKITTGSELSKPSLTVIRSTRGLPDDERILLIQKAQDRGWSSETVLRVRTALGEMNPDVRVLILKESAKLSHKVISALVDLDDPEKQKEVIEYITTNKLNEELSLSIIKQAKKGPLILDVQKVDEIDAVFKRFDRVYELVSAIGYNEYKTLGIRWGEALTMLVKIRDKIDEVLRAKYE